MACYQFIRHSTVTKFATVTPFTQELSPCTSQGGELGTRPTRWWWARLLRGQWSQTPGGYLCRGAGLSNPPPPTFPVHYAVSGEIKIGQNKYSCLFFAPLFFFQNIFTYIKKYCKRTKYHCGFDFVMFAILDKVVKFRPK